MYLKQNPFYILSVNSKSPRKTIIKQTDQKTFFSDDEIYKNAERTLLSPLKRITAELTWFSGLSDDTVANLVQAVDENKKIELTDTKNKYNSLTIMNIAVHNFQLSSTASDLSHNIIIISYIFDILIYTAIKNIINKDRKIAGWTPLTEEEAEYGINFLKDTLFSVLDEKTKTLQEDIYIDFIDSSIEKSINNNVFGSIAEKLINAYEDKMSDILTEKSGILLNYIHFFSALSSKKKLINLSDDFISYAKVLMKGYRHFGKKYSTAEKITERLLDIIQKYIDNDCTSEAAELLMYIEDKYKDVIVCNNVFAEKINKHKEVLEKNKDLSFIKKLNKIVVYAENINNEFNKFLDIKTEKANLFGACLIQSAGCLIKLILLGLLNLIWVYFILFLCDLFRIMDVF